MTKEPPDRVTDEELVRRVQDDPTGSPGRAAGRALFSRYHDRLYAWCYRHLGDRDRAMDLAQESMLAAWRALPSFEGRSKFSSWLFAIARFRCVSALRRPRLVLDQEQDADALPHPGGDPVDALIESEDEERAIALFRGVLDPDEQTALWLRCYERMPVDEITRVLKLDSRSGARGLLQTARRKLRAALAARDGEETR
jgi:RNA polymerase sigma-70 factor (ECF subfamily)